MSGLLVIFLCYLFAGCNGAERVSNLSREEDLELEKQLELLNKPYVKTIKTIYGQIYDCVDFYKQPAFDHPLLRNHSYHFQMKPKFVVEKKFGHVVEKKNRTLPNKTARIGLPDGGCPVGTVPIKRITKEDLIRERRASKIGLSETITSLARTKNPEQYTGALGSITPYNPVATGEQYSAARIQLSNADEYLQFGWRVDPSLYGDTHTHIFIKTNAGSAQCFDARCGFVLAGSSVTPGLIYPPDVISIPGKRHFETLLRVRKDKDGNWWLAIQNDVKAIGFWPSKLFTKLVNFATDANWGGEVYSPLGVLGLEMGSGYRPTKNMDTDAYMRYITAFDISGNQVNPDTEWFDNENQHDFYNVIDDPTGLPVLGHMVYFGGKSA